MVSNSKYVLESKRWKSPQQASCVHRIQFFLKDNTSGFICRAVSYGLHSSEYSAICFTILCIYICGTGKACNQVFHELRENVSHFLK